MTAKRFNPSTYEERRAEANKHPVVHNPSSCFGKCKLPQGFIDLIVETANTVVGVKNPHIEFGREYESALDAKHYLCADEHPKDAQVYATLCHLMEGLSKGFSAGVAYGVTLPRPRKKT